MCFPNNFFIIGICVQRDEILFPIVLEVLTLFFLYPGPASLVVVVVVNNTISLSNSRLRSAGKEEKMNDEERKRKTREYA